MAVKWEKIEPNVGVLEVEVEPEQVSSAIDRAFKRVVQRVNVPGFRKGKVPRKIFEARFGVASLYEDALDILLPQAYSQAVQEAEVEPVSRPEIDVQQMEQGKSLRFTARITVKPEVILGDYKNIQYEPREFVVGENEIEEELERLRQGHAEWHVVENGAVERGDRIVLDFNGFVDEEPFEGGEAENFQLEIGSGTMVAGFEDQLVGLQQGEDAEFTVTFPGDYHVKSLRDKEALFKCRIHDIKRKVLPELDDDFAKDISEFETFEELKNDLVHNLEHRMDHEREHYMRDSVAQRAVEQAAVDIPEVMIDVEIDHQMREFEGRLQQQGVPLDAYQEFTGLTTEELRSQFRTDAEQRVKSTLVLEAIAHAEGIGVNDEECDLEVQKLADSIGAPFSEAKKVLLDRDPGLELFKEGIRTRKTVDFLVSHSATA